MKPISETKALKLLHEFKARFARRIRGEFEHKAKSCSACETPGACCLDAHFVNVHITRLEAAAIISSLGRLPEAKLGEIEARIDAAIAEYGLTDEGDTFARPFACPLFEKGTGCLVHEYGKPLPCITHACYERKEDLPPDELLTAAELEVERLGRRVYGTGQKWRPLPLAVQDARTKKRTKET